MVMGRGRGSRERIVAGDPEQGGGNELAALGRAGDCQFATGSEEAECAFARRKGELRGEELSLIKPDLRNKEIKGVGGSNARKAGGKKLS